MTKKKFERRLNSLHWFVFLYDFNNKSIREYDVFCHGSFRNALLKANSKTLPEFEDFDTYLRAQTRYAFWSKCEYEVLIAGWPPVDGRPEERKIDIFDQLDLNWKLFSRYVYNKLFGDAKYAE